MVRPSSLAQVNRCQTQSFVIVIVIIIIVIMPIKRLPVGTRSQLGLYSFNQLSPCKPSRNQRDVWYSHCDSHSKVACSFSEASKHLMTCICVVSCHVVHQCRHVPHPANQTQWACLAVIGRDLVACLSALPMNTSFAVHNGSACYRLLAL